MHQKPEWKGAEERKWKRDKNDALPEEPATVLRLYMCVKEAIFGGNFLDFCFVGEKGGFQ